MNSTADIPDAEMDAETFDVIVIGAGLSSAQQSGYNAISTGLHLLECREAIGGTGIYFAIPGSAPIATCIPWL